MKRPLRIAALVCLLLFVAPNSAHAYVGPGAGFALAGSFFAVFAAAFSAFVMLLTWPVRLLLRSLFGRKPPAKARVKRVVILGLDGLDHGLTAKMLEEGKLPNLAKLRDRGSFQSLGSTLPPISPVAFRLMKPTSTFSEFERRAARTTSPLKSSRTRDIAPFTFSPTPAVAG